MVVHLHNYIICTHVYQVWKTMVVLVCACVCLHWCVHCVSVHVSVHWAGKQLRKRPRENEDKQQQEKGWLVPMNALEPTTAFYPLLVKQLC